VNDANRIVARRNGFALVRSYLSWTLLVAAVVFGFLGGFDRGGEEMSVTADVATRLVLGTTRSADGTTYAEYAKARFAKERCSAVKNSEYRFRTSQSGTEDTRVLDVQMWFLSDPPPGCASLDGARAATIGSVRIRDRRVLSPNPGVDYAEPSWLSDFLAGRAP
jgi:hypothetical protein